MLNEALFFFFQSTSNLCFTLQSLWISLTIHETHTHKFYIKALSPNTPNSIRNRSLWLLVQLVHLFLYVIGFHVGWTSRFVLRKRKITFFFPRCHTKHYSFSFSQLQSCVLLFSLSEFLSLFMKPTSTSFIWKICCLTLLIQWGIEVIDFLCNWYTCFYM